MSTPDDSGSGVESAPLAAVNSLRSRFEQLAAADHSTNVKSSTLSHGLLSPTPPSRPRTPTGTLNSKSTTSLLMESPSSPSRLGNHHLRTSSSSSDLKGTKRAPPPPPPSRASKPGAHSPSLLSRPVPPPGSIAHPASPTSSPNGNVLRSDEDSITPSTSHFAALRDVFANHSHQAPPAPIPQSPFLTPSSSMTSHPSGSKHHEPPPSPKPLVPPRRVISPSPSARSLSDPFSSGSQLSSQPPPANSDTGSDCSSDSLESFSMGSLSQHRRHPSSFSSESEINAGHSPIPPKFPPRAVKVDTNITSPPPPPHRPPPALPQRRPTALPDSVLSPEAPPLPCRPSIVTAVVATSPDDSPLPTPVGIERRGSKFAPPPSRRLQPGEALPPVRPPPNRGGSSSEPEEEESKTHSPDMNHSSRQPPLLFPHLSGGGKGKGVEGAAGSDPRITCHHSSEVVLAAPYAVVPTHHHIKIFMLPTPSPMVHVHHGANYTTPEPIFTIDTRSFGLKDPPKIVSVAFRHTCAAQDRGRLLWLGMKEGHLFEIDIRTGKVTGMRLSAHSSSISHIWRRGTCMVTADEAGKVLIFDCASGKDGADVKLTQSNPPPRVVRVSEKADFKALSGGLLWTSCRAEMQFPNTSHRNTLLRVYDIFNTGYQVFSVLPTGPTGFVTGATELDGDRVYLSHEQGSISVWSVNTTTPEEPRCMEVVKCGASDYTSCLGVCGKLWVGTRSGAIHTFDVESQPWVLTNSWYAHNKDLPVNRLTVDLTLGNSAEPNLQRWNGLGVASVGRDEIVRFWDGTLMENWIGAEMFKREPEFSKLRQLKMVMMSWNCDSARPEDLHGSAPNFTLLHDVLSSVESPDILYFGFQEVVDLESRGIVAKNVFMGGNKRSKDSADSYNYQAIPDENVTRAYRRWHDHLCSAVRLAMPADCPYEVIFSESLVGLFTCIFIKSKERVLLQDVAVGYVKRGLGGRYGNKGGTLARFVIEDTSICLINCHLAAGQSHLRQRNADVASLLGSKDQFPIAQHNLAYSSGGDGTMVLDHEIVFFHGDMNYRIDQRRDTTIALIQKGEWEGLMNHDQLLKEMKYNRGFALKTFSEGPLQFIPTYKYDRRTNTFDSSEKKRCPAWCDRILWKSFVPERVRQLHYKRYEADVSDHRPISAGFEFTVKSLRHEIRQVVKEEILLRWAEEQKRLLEAEKKFFCDSGLAVL